MKKAFKKFGVLVLSLLLIVAAMPICAIAADGIDVKLSGINVTAAEGTIGVGVAEKGKDYTTVLTAREGYEIFHIMVYGIGSAPDDVYHPSFEFDYETGVLTVPKEKLSAIESLDIEVVAGRNFNYETDVTTVSELPYVDTYTLEETDVTKDFNYAVKFFKVDLALGEGLDIKFYGTDNEDANSLIEIYTYNEESGMEYVTRFDLGPLGMGKKATFVPDELGTYYVATMCFNNYIGESYTLEMSVIENATALPNFIEEGHKNLSGHLWDWNAETKTLNLSNAFDTTNYEGNGISLPEGSTVIVNYGAVSVSAEGYGIYCEGKLDIKLNYGSIDIESAYDAIVAEKGDITITSTRQTDGSPEHINMDAPYGIYIYEEGDINIDDCEINIECTYDGITACYGDINITNSDTTISSDEGCGVVSFDSQMAGIGNVNVSGGRIQIVSYGPTLYAERGLVSLEDVALFLCTEDETAVIATYCVEDFSVPGHFSMLDANGNYIVENKEWVEDYYRPLTGVYNPDGSITRAAAIVTVADAEQNNMVSGIEKEYVQGDSICITVESEVLEYPVAGNTSWFPTGWKIVGTELEGIFYSGWVAILTNALDPGEYVIEVTFEKHIYSDDQWVFDGENVEVIPVVVTIIEEANSEEEPTPGTGTGSGSIAGGSDEIIIDVIIPDLETPDIPNTSVESNATALAVLSLTVGGALLLTFKRKEK